MRTRLADNSNSDKVSKIKKEPLVCCECCRTLKHVNKYGEVRVTGHYVLPSGIRCEQCYVNYRKWWFFQIT